MKKRINLLLAGLLLAVAVMSQSGDEAAIRKILNDQQAAWNAGNLDQFMVGYWDNDSLMYIGRSGITYGYRQTLATYKKNYGDTARMGKFTSTIVHMKRLSKDAWFVVGKWYLKRSIGDASGYYTLVFRRIGGNWVIVADHSS